MTEMFFVLLFQLFVKKGADMVGRVLLLISVFALLDSQEVTVRKVTFQTLAFTYFDLQILVMHIYSLSINMYISFEKIRNHSHI